MAFAIICIYKVNKKLYEDSVIPYQDFKSKENAYQFQLKRKSLSEKTLTQDSITTKQQLAQMKESYNRMQGALELMRCKVGDLIVRAPVDGSANFIGYGSGTIKKQRRKLRAT